MISTWMFVDAYGVCGERVRAYWWQDDPVAAAALWRRDAERLAAGDRRLTESSDIVVAVSESVVGDLRARGVERGLSAERLRRRLLRRGGQSRRPARRRACGGRSPASSATSTAAPTSPCSRRSPTSEASLLLIGPNDPGFEPARLAALAARPNVAALGPRRFEDLLPYLKAIDVGIVPYANTQFNRNSFPMKTFEYLAAGKPVVSTPLPAVRSLQTDLVATAEAPAEFAAAVLAAAAEARDPDRVAARRRFAGGHSWQVRAEQLADLLQLRRTERAGAGSHEYA